MKVMLYSDGNKGKTVKTSFGPITFDMKGYADADVREEDLQKCKNLGWLVEGSATLESLRDDLIGQYEVAMKAVEAIEERIKKVDADIVERDNKAKNETDTQKMARLEKEAQALAKEEDKRQKDAAKAAEKAQKEAAAAARQQQPAPIADAKKE